MDNHILRVPTSQSTPTYAVLGSTLTFKLWLEFEWWEPQPDDDPHTNFFNLHIALSDGRHYGLNVWTYNYLNVVRQDDIATGDNLDGAYLLPPDLLVSKLDRSHIAAVVADLIERNRLNEQWQITEGTDVNATDDDAGDQHWEDPIFAQFIARARLDGRIIDHHEDEGAS